jgi:hypothetical protein
MQLLRPTTIQRTNHSSLFRSIPTIKNNSFHEQVEGQEKKNLKNHKKIKVFLCDSV